MEDIQKHHDAIFQGLGGSFDVYTGRVKEHLMVGKAQFGICIQLIKEPKRIKTTNLPCEICLLVNDE